MKITRFLGIGFYLLFFSICFSQTIDLKPAFHQDRREQIRSKLPVGGLAIFVSNPRQIRSADTEHRYKQNTDLYYLSGINETNVILFIFKNKIEINGSTVDEVLFVSPKNQNEELWTGKMLGEAGAKAKSGISLALSNLTLKDISFIPSSIEHVFADFPQFENVDLNQPLIHIIDMINKKYKLEGKTLNAWMNELRGIKTKEEIEILRHAILISGHGHIEAIKSIQPGVSERQIQGVHEFVHRVHGSDDEGYLPIIGADNNGCILHYSSNDKSDLQERLVLMDVGAEYKSYTGDITRTAPVKGFFNTEEKLLYDLVLKSLEAGIQTAKSGKSFIDINKACRKVINDGLVELGLIKINERHNFLPHGVSHHLGLDVHDRGNYDTLQSGMVITVEPGIYIPENSKVDKKWWGIGIRIEDNILITQDGNENLSAFVPKTTEAIEALMRERGILQTLQN